MPQFTPLSLAKRDAPKDPHAAAALTGVVKAIATATPAMKTKTANVEFWNALSDYASRNIAELAGARSKPAPKAEKPAKTKPAKAKTEKTLAAVA